MSIILQLFTLSLLHPQIFDPQPQKTNAQYAYVLSGTKMTMVFTGGLLVGKFPLEWMKLGLTGWLHSQWRMTLPQTHLRSQLAHQSTQVKEMDLLSIFITFLIRNGCICPQFPPNTRHAPPQYITLLILCQIWIVFDHMHFLSAKGNINSNLILIQNYCIF